MNRTSDWGLLVGRLALVALYLLSALAKFGTLSHTAGLLAAKGFPFPMPLIIFTATAELIGAICVAVGFYPRAAAIGLIFYSIIATVTFHDFWMFEGEARQNQMIHFMKNVGLIGGFLLIASVGVGAFSVDGLRKSRSPKSNPAVA